jgi:hypothetical protein
MSPPRPSPQNAIRNIPQVVVRPTWENVVACAYLPKASSLCICSDIADRQQTGSDILHSAPIFVPATQSPLAPRRTAQSVHHIEPLHLDLHTTGAVPQALPA